MKTITKLLLALQLFIAASVSGQTGNLTVRTTVLDQSTGLAVPNHLVMLTVYPDSMNIIYPIHDSALTDPAGFCEMTLDVPYSGQGVVNFSVSTPECNNNLQTQYFTYSGQSELINVTFGICNGTPSGCENFIEITNIEQTTVTFIGGLYNQQDAEFTWDFGDGAVGNGIAITHTYNSPGIYLVNLQTVTNDSCYDASSITVYLQDSVNFDCINFIEFVPLQDPLEIQFFGNITSLYPTEFEWNFGDPASGAANISTLQNPVHLFNAQGTYNITLSTVDTSGCEYTSTVLAMVNGGGMPSFIMGSVIAGNSFLDLGSITLFVLDSMGYYIPVQTTSIDSMMYFFPEAVLPGNYLIQAQPSPNSMYFGSYLPTFYESSLFWEDATQVILGQAFNPYDITLVAYDSIIGGPGMIAGQIIGGGKSTTLAGIEILLLNENNEPVRLTYTDAAGNFSFGDLPYGTYKLNPVVTGYTIDIYPCNLNEGNQTAEMVLEINGHEIAAVRKIEKALVAESAYPNPVTSVLNIKLAKEVSGNLTARIYNNNGTLLNANEINAYSSEIIKMNMSNLPAGLYSVILIDSKGNSNVLQFIKQ